MRFETPFAFLLLFAIPVVLYLHGRRGRGTALRFSSTKNAVRAGTSLRQRLAIAPIVLRVVALVLLTLALARPQQGLERVRDASKGIAIEMVVDRSGSMAAEMVYEGERLNRLEVVKRVFHEFVRGNGKELDGRPNDLIGLVSFARYADTICPLTLGHDALNRLLENTQLVQRRNEDGTAIGDAISLAAARLKTAEQNLADQATNPGADYEIKSKVVILLTDGQHNAGEMTPGEAAALAAEWGIKIYTIGVGGGESTTKIQTPFGAYLVPTGSDLDERTLQGIAEATGGVYRRAEDAESLRAIYAEIDELERTEIESVRYMDYRELFMPLVLAALLTLIAEIILLNTWFRRVP